MRLEGIKQRNNGNKGMMVQRIEVKFNDNVRALMHQQNWLEILQVDLN